MTDMAIAFVVVASLWLGLYAFAAAHAFIASGY